MRGRLCLLLGLLLLAPGCHRSMRSDKATADCRHSESVCGRGTICAADEQYLVDCREDLAGSCGPGLLCNQSTGACVTAQNLNCNEVPGLCWEGQVCDAPTGYCREATIDTALAYGVQLYDYTLHVDTAASTFSGQVSIFLVATRSGTTTLTLAGGQAGAPARAGLNESLASFYTAEVLGGRSAFPAEMDRMKAAIFKAPARYDDDALRCP